MVLTRCHTISKSIATYEDFGDGIDRLNDYPLDRVYSPRNERLHPIYRREETGKTTELAATTESTTKSKEKITSLKATKHAKSETETLTTTALAAETSQVPELTNATLKPTMNLFRRIQHKFSRKNKTKTMKSTTKKQRHKKHKEIKKDETANFVGRDKRYLTDYWDRNASFFRHFKTTTHKMRNLFFDEDNASTNMFSTDRTNNGENSIETLAIDTKSNANSEMNYPPPYTSPTERNTIPQYLDDLDTFRDTASIETLFNKIKLHAMNIISEQSPMVGEIITNTVTETTFDADPLMRSLSATRSVEEPLILGDEDVELVESVEDNKKTQTPNSLQDMKTKATTMTTNLEQKLQREIKDALKKAKNTLADGINKACDQVKSVTWKIMHNSANGLAAVTSGIKTKEMVQETTPISEITKESPGTNNLQAQIQETKTTAIQPTKLTTLSTSVKKAARPTTRQNRATSIGNFNENVETTTEDDYYMLKEFEVSLAKKHEDNVMKMLTVQTPANKPFKDVFKVSKRDTESIENLNLNKNIRNQNEGEGMPDEDYNVDHDKTKGNKISVEVYHDDNPTTLTESTIRELAAPDNSYAALSNKIHFNEFINGYKHYLNFARDLSKFDSNFSNRVCYQAHRHHNVDDIGKFILTRLPPIPDYKSSVYYNPQRRDKRYFFDSTDIENNDISTKSEESWFRRHFYIFHDKPPKKFHTEQTITLKTKDAVQIKIGKDKNTSERSETTSSEPAYTTNESEGLEVVWKTTAHSSPHTKQETEIPSISWHEATQPFTSTISWKDTKESEPEEAQTPMEEDWSKEDTSSMQDKLSKLDKNLNDFMNKISQSTARARVTADVPHTTPRSLDTTTQTEIHSTSMDLTRLLQSFTSGHATDVCLNELVSALVLKNYTATNRIKKWHKSFIMENPLNVINKLLSKSGNNNVKEFVFDPNKEVDNENAILQGISGIKRDKRYSDSRAKEFNYRKYTTPYPFSMLFDQAALYPPSDDKYGKLGYVDLNLVVKPSTTTEAKITKSKYKILNKLKSKKKMKNKNKDKKLEGGKSRKERHSPLKMLKNLFKISQPYPDYSLYVKTEPDAYKFLKTIDIDRSIKEFMKQVPNISKPEMNFKPEVAFRPEVTYKPTGFNKEPTEMLSAIPIDLIMHPQLPVTPEPATYYRTMPKSDVPLLKKDKSSILFNNANKYTPVNFRTSPVVEHATHTPRLGSTRFPSTRFHVTLTPVSLEDLMKNYIKYKTERLSTMPNRYSTMPNRFSTTPRTFNAQDLILDNPVLITNNPMLIKTTPRLAPDIAKVPFKQRIYSTRDITNTEKYVTDVPKYITDMPKYITDMQKDDTDMQKENTDMQKYNTNLRKYVTDVPNFNTDMTKDITDMPNYSTAMPKYINDMPQYITEMPKYITGMPKYITDMPKYNTDMTKDITGMMKDITAMSKYITRKKNDFTSSYDNDFKKYGIQFHSLKNLLNDKDYSNFGRKDYLRDQNKENTKSYGVKTILIKKDGTQDIDNMLLDAEDSNKKKVDKDNTDEIQNLLYKKKEEKDLKDFVNFHRFQNLIHERIYPNVNNFRSVSHSSDDEKYGLKYNRRINTGKHNNKNVKNDILKRTDYSRLNSAPVLQDNNAFTETNKYYKYRNPSEPFKSTKPYKTYPDYFSDFFNWNRDILTMDHVTNPSIDAVMSTLMNVTTTVDLIKSREDIRQMKSYLKYLTTRRAPFIQATSRRTQKEMAPAKKHRFAPLKKSNSSDKFSSSDKFRRDNVEKSKFQSLDSLNQMINDINKLYSESFKKPNPDGPDFKEFMFTPLLDLEDGTTSTESLPLDATVLAYEDGLGSFAHGLGPNHKNIRDDSGSKNVPILKTKVSPLPKQYFMTPVPMQPTEFDKFLKENGFDIQNITSPYTEMSDFEERWEKSGNHIESKLMDIRGKIEKRIQLPKKIKLPKKTPDLEAIGLAPKRSGKIFKTVASNKVVLNDAEKFKMVTKTENVFSNGRDQYAYLDDNTQYEEDKSYSRPINYNYIKTYDSKAKRKIKTSSLLTTTRTTDASITSPASLHFDITIIDIDDIMKISGAQNMDEESTKASTLAQRTLPVTKQIEHHEGSDDDTLDFSPVIERYPDHKVPEDINKMEQVNVPKNEGTEDSYTQGDYKFDDNLFKVQPKMKMKPYLNKTSSKLKQSKQMDQIDLFASPAHVLKMNTSKTAKKKNKAKPKSDKLKHNDLLLYRSFIADKHTINIGSNTLPSASKNKKYPQTEYKLIKTPATAITPEHKQKTANSGTFKITDDFKEPKSSIKLTVKPTGFTYETATQSTKFIGDDLFAGAKATTKMLNTNLKPKTPKSFEERPKGVVFSSNTMKYAVYFDDTESAMENSYLKVPKPHHYTQSTGKNKYDQMTTLTSTTTMKSEGTDFDVNKIMREVLDNTGKPGRRRRKAMWRKWKTTPMHKPNDNRDMKKDQLTSKTEPTTTNKWFWFLSRKGQKEDNSTTTTTTPMPGTSVLVINTNDLTSSPMLTDPFLYLDDTKKREQRGGDSLIYFVDVLEGSNYSKRVATSPTDDKDHTLSPGNITFIFPARITNQDGKPLLNRGDDIFVEKPWSTTLQHNLPRFKPQDQSQEREEIQEHAADKKQDQLKAKAGQSQAGQSQAGQSQIGQLQTGQSQMGQSKASQSQAGQSQTGQSQIGQSQASQSQIGQSQASQSQAGQSRTGQSQAGQSLATQSQAAQPLKGQSQAAQSLASQSQAGQLQKLQSQSGQSQAVQSQAGQSQKGQSQSGQSQAGQSQAGQSIAGQSLASQSQARQQLQAKPQEIAQPKTAAKPAAQIQAPEKSCDKNCKVCKNLKDLIFLELNKLNNENSLNIKEISPSNVASVFGVRQPNKRLVLQELGTDSDLPWTAQVSPQYHIATIVRCPDTPRTDTSFDESNLSNALDLERPTLNEFETDKSTDAYTIEIIKNEFVSSESPELETVDFSTRTTTDEPMDLPKLENQFSAMKELGLKAATLESDKQLLPTVKYTNQEKSTQCCTISSLKLPSTKYTLDFGTTRNATEMNREIVDMEEEEDRDMLAHQEELKKLSHQEKSEKNIQNSTDINRDLSDIEEEDKENEKLPQQDQLKNEKFLQDQLKNEKFPQEDQLKNQKLPLEDQLKDEKLPQEEQLKNEKLPQEDQLKNEKLPQEDQLKKTSDQEQSEQHIQKEIDSALDKIEAAEAKSLTSKKPKIVDNLKLTSTLKHKPPKEYHTTTTKTKATKTKLTTVAKIKSAKDAFEAKTAQARKETELKKALERICKQKIHVKTTSTKESYTKLTSKKVTSKVTKTSTSVLKNPATLTPKLTTSTTLLPSSKKNNNKKSKTSTTITTNEAKLTTTKTVGSIESKKLKLQKSKIFKRQTTEPFNTVFTAKDVAALEVIVDLMKEPGESATSKHTTGKTINGNFDYHPSTSAIQVHIGVPYLIQDRKRSALEPAKLRKVFSAKMSIPVDIEYQVRSLDNSDKMLSTYTGCPNKSGISPGMYLLVEDTKQNRGFALKPVSRQIKQDLVTSTIKTDNPKSLSRVTLSKDYIQSINKQLIELYQKLSALDNTTRHTIKRSFEDNGRTRYRRKICWEKVLEYVGHDNRVCNCKCVPNKPMCRTCAASDAVMTELIFEFDNLSKYMSDHCTEIQTFFWMNPSAGRKLRDIVQKIDKSVTDYYKRVKDKCQGRPCSCVEKRQFTEPVVENYDTYIQKSLLSEFEDLALSLQQIQKLKLNCNEKFKDILDRFVKISKSCVKDYKDKRSLPVQKVYSLDNINVNIICNDNPSYHEISTLPDSTNDISTSDFSILDYTDDEVKHKKTTKTFTQMFAKKKGKRARMKPIKRDAIVQIESPVVVETDNLWKEYLKDAKATTVASSERPASVEPVVTLGVLEKVNKNTVSLNPSLKATLVKIGDNTNVYKNENNADAKNDIFLQMMPSRVSRKYMLNIDEMTTKSESLSHDIKELIKLFESLPGGQEVKFTAEFLNKLTTTPTEKNTKKDIEISMTVKTVKGTSPVMFRQSPNVNLPHVSVTTVTSSPLLETRSTVDLKDSETSTTTLTAQADSETHSNNIKVTPPHTTSKEGWFQKLKNKVVMITPVFENNKIPSNIMNSAPLNRKISNKNELKAVAMNAYIDVNSDMTTTSFPTLFILEDVANHVATKNVDLKDSLLLNVMKYEKDAIDRKLTNIKKRDNFKLDDEINDILLMQQDKPPEAAKAASELEYADGDYCLCNRLKKLKSQLRNSMTSPTPVKPTTTASLATTKLTTTTKAPKKKSLLRLFMDIKKKKQTDQRVLEDKQQVHKKEQQSSPEVLPQPDEQQRIREDMDWFLAQFASTILFESTSSLAYLDKMTETTPDEFDENDMSHVSLQNFSSMYSHTPVYDYTTEPSTTSKVKYVPPTTAIKPKQTVTSPIKEKTTTTTSRKPSSKTRTIKIMTPTDTTKSSSVTTPISSSEPSPSKTSSTTKTTSSGILTSTKSTKSDTITKKLSTMKEIIDKIEKTVDDTLNPLDASKRKEKITTPLTTKKNSETLTSKKEEKYSDKTKTKGMKVKNKGYMHGTVPNKESTSESGLNKVLNKNNLKEACDLKTEACLCDIRATSDHILDVRRTMSKRDFEIYVRNLTCYRYMKPPPFFLLEPWNRKIRKHEHQKQKRFNKYFDSAALQKSIRWDWIRKKRELLSVEDYESDTDLDDDNEENSNSEANFDTDVNAHQIELNDAYKLNSEDDFEKLYKGEDNVYRTYKKRQKRTTGDMQELVHELKNLPPIQSRQNELFAMLGDKMSLDCLHRSRSYKSDTPVFWDTERTNMLSPPDVVIDGPMVILNKVHARHTGNYTCSQDGKTRTVKLTVVTLPQFFVVFIPMYSSTHGCSYDDLRAMQRLGPLMTSGNYACARNNSSSIKIDEPICLEDKDDGSIHLRATAILTACQQPDLHCSAQCRRDLQCAFALLCAANAPVLYNVQVVVERQGYNKTLVPSFKTSRRLIVTHTLRKKELQKHPEYHQLAASMYPGNLDIVVSCPAGYYLLPKQKICVACPADTYAGAGENTCYSCAAGTSSEPGSARCKLSLRKMRRYDWWWYPPCGFALAGVGVLCACVVCTACALSAHVTSRSTVRAHAAAVSVARADSHATRSQHYATKRFSTSGATRGGPPSPSAVILARFFRASASSSRATDSQETKFEIWKEKNNPPPLPPIDFDLG